MLPIFLVLLVSGLASILLSLKAAHEISRLLAFASGVICLIGGFAMAPWPIQLLISLLIFKLEWLSPISEAVTVKSTIFPSRRK